VRKKNKKGPKRKQANSGGQRRRASSKRTETDKQKDELFGLMAGKVETVGDIESPIEDWEHWNPAKSLEK
jgi:hypothetical protein